MIDLSLHQYPYRSEGSQERPAPSPAAPSSSSPSLPSQEPASNTTSFAFLVHSQDTIPNNLPPSVDNKPLARARRRRTSPEDQSILEAEFQRDSKPDRAARARIVERVALGEKEVQIWFQNRRQNSRRKSRPLLPHEILPHLQTSRISGNSSQSPPLSRSGTDLSDSCVRGSSELGSAMSLGSDGDAGGNKLQPLVKMESSSPIMESFDSQECQPGNGPSQSLTLEPTMTNEEILVEIAQSIETGARRTTEQNAQPDVEAPAVREEGIESAVEVPRSEREQTPVETAPPEANQSEDAAPNVKSKPSRVRLSMTSDGVAKILTGDESSPSPAKSRSPEEPLSASRGLRRSYSTAGLDDPSNTLSMSRRAPGIRRVLSGRSRDSRAWEFWCDSEARNVLAKKADQEQSGSAADAISLMRSTSRSALTPLSNKGNIRLFDNSLTKREKDDHPVKSRPVFGRAQSSVGRLQGGNHGATERRKDGGFKKSITIDLSGADSDKENWDPIPGISAATSRRLQGGPPTRKPWLGESRTAPSSRGTSSSRRQPERKHSKLDHGKENLDPEDDEEIASFMRGNRTSGGQRDNAREDDLDCIQGLLSLSQGNWK